MLSTTPNPHERTRRDHATETAEDYVEAANEIIQATGRCGAVDLATRFRVSYVTVNRTVSRLQGQNLVETEPYGPICLTVKGRRLANQSAKRDAIVLRFLQAIGVDERTAATDAEGIEHHVSPGTLKRLEAVARSLEESD